MRNEVKEINEQLKKDFAGLQTGRGNFALQKHDTANRKIKDDDWGHEVTRQHDEDFSKTKEGTLVTYYKHLV